MGDDKRRISQHGGYNQSPIDVNDLIAETKDRRNDAHPNRNAYQANEEQGEHVTQDDHKSRHHVLRELSDRHRIHVHLLMCSVVMAGDGAAALATTLNTARVKGGYLSA